MSAVLRQAAANTMKKSTPSSRLRLRKSALTLVRVTLFLSKFY